MSAIRTALVLAFLTGPASGGQEEVRPAKDGTLLHHQPIQIDEAVLAPLDAEKRAQLEQILSEVQVESIVYASEGLEVAGYVLIRKDAAKGKPLPCLIFNRGGNRDFGALDDLRVAFLLGRIAQRGYVVVASQYRGNGAFGKERYPPSRFCPDCKDPIGGVGREEFGGAEVADVLNLIPLLEGLPYADASRIGMYGWSRGGMMTYLALARTDRIAAAIVGAGVADAHAMVAERPDMVNHVLRELIPGWGDEFTRGIALDNRSAVQWPNLMHAETPILLLHGTGDWRVSPTQALRMADALYEVQHPFRLVMLEGGDHGLTEHRREVDRLIDDWLDRYVRDRKPWPSLEPHGK